MTTEADIEERRARLLGPMDGLSDEHSSKMSANAFSRLADCAECALGRAGHVEAGRGGVVRRTGGRPRRAGNGRDVQRNGSAGEGVGGNGLGLGSAAAVPWERGGRWRRQEEARRSARVHG